VYLGVTSILNFAATVLAVPEGINVRKVDLGQELRILAFHEQRKTEDPRGVPGTQELSSGGIVR
jgi:redox-sensing transcriptional repressor